MSAIEKEWLDAAKLKLPEPFTKPSFKEGGSMGEYKQYMIDRLKYEEWENSILLMAKKNEKRSDWH